MRCNIIHPQADELIYEIRRIVLSAKRMEKAGLEITWENIGDPVAKGEEVPDWIVEHLDAVIKDIRTWAYSPTKGIDETREFVAGMTNDRGGVQITQEAVYFYNGLGDAVSKLYRYLDRKARVLCPSPCYPIHATQEWFHAGPGAQQMLYRLDPANGWLPDIEEIRTKVRENPGIAGIMLINPDNPTGTVWPGELVAKVVEIAGEYDLFVVADEIYHRLTYSGEQTTLFSDVIGKVPGISLKGISKEYPWPGSRCGWMEIYNEDSSPQFKRYVRSLFDAKMLEVCSTTHPQMTIPRVMADQRYPEHLKKRCETYHRRGGEFYDTFKDLEGVLVTRPSGAFYASVVFKDGLLNNRQSLKVDNPQVREVLVEALEQENLSPDKRLVLHLLAATGICLVPMTGFSTDLQGFRMTLLESDDSKRAWILSTLREKIEEYLGSG